jgi:cytochrome b561
LHSATEHIEKHQWEQRHVVPGCSAYAIAVWRIPVRRLLKHHQGSRTHSSQRRRAAACHRLLLVIRSVRISVLLLDLHAFASAISPIVADTIRD